MQRRPSLRTWMAGLVGLVGLIVGISRLPASAFAPVLAEVAQGLGERFEEVSGLRVHFGDIRIEAARARVTLAPVSVRDQEGSDILRAEEVALTFSWGALWDAFPGRGSRQATTGAPPGSRKSRAGPRPLVERLEVIRPTLTLQRRGGRWRGAAPGTARPLEEGTWWDTLCRAHRSVASLQIREGSFQLAVDDQTIAARRVDLHMRADPAQPVVVDMGAKEFTVAQPQRRASVTGVAARLQLVEDDAGCLTALAIDTLDVQAAPGRAHVVGEVGLPREGRAPRLALEVHTTIALASLAAELDPARAWQGDVSSDFFLTTSGDEEGWQVAGVLEVADLALQGRALGTLRGNVSANPGGLDLPDFAWHLADTVVEGSAALRFDDPTLPFRVSARVEDFSLYKLLRGLRVPSVWTEVRFDGSAQGQGRIWPEFSFDAQVSGAAHALRVAAQDIDHLPDERCVLVIGAPIDSLMDVQLDSSGVRVEGTWSDGLTRAGGKARFSFRADEGMWLRVESDRLNFATVQGRIGRLRYEGEGAGEVQVEGPYRDLRVTSLAWLRQFKLQDFAFGDVAGRIDWRRGKLAFSDLALRKGLSTYGGDVLLDFRHPLQRGDLHPAHPLPVPPAGLHLSVDVTIDRAQAEELRGIIPSRYQKGTLGFLRTLPLEGMVEGAGHAHGYIGDGSTDHLRGAGTLQGGEGVLLAGERFEEASAAFRVGMTEVVVEDLSFSLGGGRGSASFRIERESGGLRGAYALSGVELGRLGVLRRLPQGVQGVAELRGTLEQHAREPGTLTTFAVRDFRVGELFIGLVQGSLSHREGTLLVDTRLWQDRGQGQLQVDTQGPLAFRASLDLARGPLQTLLPAGWLPGELEVEAGISIGAHGTLGAEEPARGSVVLHGLSLRHRGLVLRAEGDSLAHFQGDRLSIDQLELQSPRRDRVSLRGDLDPRQVDLRLEGHAGLWFAPLVAPAIRRASGQVRFEVALRGPPAATSLAGQARVTQGSFAIDALPHPVEGVEGRLALRAGELRIESLRGRIEEAPFEVHGSVTHEQGRPDTIDLVGRFENLPLRVPAWLSSRSSGEISLRGPVQLPTLAGDVQILRSEVTDDIDWERWLPGIRRSVERPMVFDRAEEDVRFDLRLRSEGGLRWRDDLIDLEAKGDLLLTGTDERPGLLGSLSLLRGDATIRGNRFRVPSATVEFIDRYRVSAWLDVEAETRVKDFDISARISGPAQDPRIALESRPQLAEVDIISLLTFGFTQFDLRDANLSAGAAGLEVVSAYTGLEGELRRVLPPAVRQIEGVSMDELRLTSLFSNRQGANVPALAIGFEMNPGVWALDGSHLRLQATLLNPDGKGSEQRVEWEKRFDNDLRLRMVWNSQAQGNCPSCVNNPVGDVGGDLWYRWEF